MSDFCYHVLALIPVNAQFSISKAVETYTASGYQAAQITSPRGKGFQVAYAGNWTILAWFEEDTAEENQEIINSYGNPPGVSSEEIIRCDNRLSIWSDDDSEMMNAHLFEEHIDFLKEKFKLYIFDNVQGIWR
jgi:hypothetical protein